MDRMTEYLVRAAWELGLAVEAPFPCDLGDGTVVVAVAYFPELGGTGGTLIFRTSQFDRRAFRLLQSRGFGCSAFGDPLDSEQFDLDAYREMFLDWGWTSKSKAAPRWMDSAKCDGE